jgi:hypothetical protein
MSGVTRSFMVNHRLMPELETKQKLAALVEGAQIVRKEVGG